jgi:hypothetical protein
MPARIIIPTVREARISAVRVRLPKNSVKLYEHGNFKEEGRTRLLRVTEISPQLIHSLHTMDFKDCLSSLEWNLEPGIIVEFSEHHDGGGRKYQIWGSGRDGNTHNNNFKDCASAWAWYRTS